MQLRALGSTAVQVSPLMFGGNVFGWTADEPTSFALLDAFSAAGGNLIDTADVYSVWATGHQGGESETIIGRWLKQRGKRDDVVLATKVGMQMAADRKGLSAAHIQRSAEDSLRRLQTDYIDVYFAHADDPETPLEETLTAFTRLVEQGKVKYLGASNYTAARLEEALKISQSAKLAPFQVLQPLYNLYDRAPYEAELESVSRKHRLGVVTYFSLARGFLSGKYRTENDLHKSPRGAGVKKYINERGQKILATLDELSLEYHAPLASIALAWIMARSSVTSAIASATSLIQLHALIEATRLKLSPAAIQKLDAASSE